MVLLAFIGAMLGPALAGGKVLATGDSLAYYWPIRVLVANMWLAGVPPFWNPYGFGGLPLWAAIQAGPLFPGNFPFLICPPGLAMNLTVALAYFVGGTGMLSFGRALGLPAVAGLLGAIVFTGSGFMLAHMEHLTAVQTGAMLPWLLFAIARHRATRDERWAIALAVLIGIQVLAGYPQLVFQSALVAGPYALWRARDVVGSDRLRHVAELVAAMGLGLALGMVMISPLAAFLAGNSRIALDPDLYIYTRFSPLHLGTMIFPFMFGAPPSAFYSVPYWGIGPFFADVFGYIGLGSLMLGGVAIASRRTRSEAAFWVGLTLLATVLMMGPRALFEYIYMVPIVNAMRAPARHVFEFDVAVSVLAALGFAALLAADAAKVRRLALLGLAPVLATVAASAAMVGLLGPWYARRAQAFVPGEINLSSALHLSQPAFWAPILTVLAIAAALAVMAHRRTAWTLGLLVAAIALDLLHVGQFVGFRTHAVPDLPAMSRWQPDLDGRVFAVGAVSYPYRDPASVAPERRPYANLFLPERHVGGAEGYVPDRVLWLLGGMNSYGWIADDRVFRDGGHALDIFSTREVRIPTASLGQPGWAMRLQPPRWQRRPDTDGLAVFANVRALPRAWRVAATVRLPVSRLDKLVASDAAFEPAQIALLDASAAEPSAAVTGLAQGTAALVAPDANHLDVTTAGAGPGFVVIGEGYDAGWSAMIDGAAARIERVDGLVMGVAVPAGAHVVGLGYEPEGFRQGLAASLGSGLALVVWGLAGRRRRRRSLGTP